MVWPFQHVNVNVRLVDRSLQGLFTVNRLNGIGPNACEGAHGCRHKIHVWSRSTANPAGCNWPGVDFSEGGEPEYPEKNPRSQVEIDWNSAHIRPEARIEPGSQRWEARLMTTKPPWLPSQRCGRLGRISLKGFCVNKTTIVYNNQKSGYLAKCWSLTQTQTQAQAHPSIEKERIII